MKGCPKDLKVFLLENFKFLKSLNKKVYDDFNQKTLENLWNYKDFASPSSRESLLYK